MQNRAVANERPHGGRLLRRASVLAGDERGLHGALREPGPWLLQRYLPRPIVSVAGVATAGGLAALVAARHVRLWPPDAGNGSFIETFHPPADLVGAVARLLASLGWLGIFQLELADVGDRLAALDLNPRPYGSIGVARAAGAPLASLWCQAALDGRVRPHARGRDDSHGHAGPVIGRAMVRYRVEDVDARHVAALLRSRRWREASAAMRPRRSVAHAYFRGDDPLPLAARALQLASRRGLRSQRRW